MSIRDFKVKNNTIGKSCSGIKTFVKDYICNNKLHSRDDNYSLFHNGKHIIDGNRPTIIKTMKGLKTYVKKI